ncbi:MAG TPA: hypothetical protein VKB46_01545 [Pyrinomonadaceae bacterium]|nr:hypothetical protein [Pyrinomonadaceae bacterium]
MQAQFILKKISSTTWIAIALFLFTFWIYSISPVRQITDTTYSMLLSQSLIEHGTFKLDGYFVPRYPPMDRGYYISDGRIYQLELANNHLYYHMPPGSSVLSLPFVALMRVFGIKAADSAGCFIPEGDSRIQIYLAVLLTALLTVIFFYTALQMLSPLMSSVVAIGAALGSQACSTASRGLWTETWSLVLLGAVVLLLLANETAKRSLNPILVASLLAWSYFVRPTNAIQIAAITVYLLIYHRRYFIPYAVTGAVWFAGFIFYSWHNYHRLLPAYYQSNRLQQSDLFWTALAGNLISPGRGLLVYVPVLFFVGYLLVRYWRYVRFQRLVVMSLVICVVHLVAISSFPHWWAGHSFGPRYMTTLLPWLVLLAILGLDAFARWRAEAEVESKPTHARRQLLAGGVLLLLSMFINIRGATNRKTWGWNAGPVGVDEYPAKLWDWRDPQFLAGIFRGHYPKFTPLDCPLDFGTDEAAQYLWFGWGAEEQGFRWSTAKQAALAFGLRPLPQTDGELQLRFGPFLANSRIPAQRVTISVNGRLIETVTLTEDKVQEYKVALPQELLRFQNYVLFDLPDANSPRDFNLGNDTRELGIALYSMRFVEKP